jgi:phasin family protein
MTVGNMSLDFSSLFGQFGEPLKNATSALKAVQDRALANSQELNLKILDIAKQNTTSTLEALKGFSTAGDLSEALNLQQAFVRERAAAGMAQFREVSDLVAKAGRETFAPVGDAMSPMTTAA